jgi:hypothetical protein
MKTVVLVAATQACMFLLGRLGIIPREASLPLLEYTGLATAFLFAPAAIAKWRILKWSPQAQAAYYKAPIRPIFAGPWRWWYSAPTGGDSLSQEELTRLKRQAIHWSILIPLAMMCFMSTWLV